MKASKERDRSSVDFKFPPFSTVLESLPKNTSHRLSQLAEVGVLWKWSFG
jgi:hypothetical protein